MVPLVVDGKPAGIYGIYRDIDTDLDRAAEAARLIHFWSKLLNE